MNILSFDIEEWSITKARCGKAPELFYEYDATLDNVLEFLDEHNIKATFFCLGQMAKDFPYVIRKIAQYGHEIGCHSYAHKWANKMTIEDFRADTYKAVSSIEDLLGQKVKSYRAPAFSFGSKNIWVFDVLAENGILNDSSIFPGTRDFGGFPEFNEQEPCIIWHNGIKIKEFPIPLLHIPVINKDIAYSGGGYFRLLPFGIVNRMMKNKEYNMCYFHLADIISQKTPLKSRKEYEEYFGEAGPLFKRLIRYWKSNVGRSNTMNNLKQLLTDFQFTSIANYNEAYEITNIAKI